MKRLWELANGSSVNLKSLILLTSWAYQTAAALPVH